MNEKIPQPMPEIKTQIEPSVEKKVPSGVLPELLDVDLDDFLDIQEHINEEKRGGNHGYLNS